MFEKLRYRILNRSIAQFIAGKNGCRMPDLDKLNSAIVILEDLDKEMVRAIEERIKIRFGITRIRFIIITENGFPSRLLKSISS